MHGAQVRSRPNASLIVYFCFVHIFSRALCIYFGGLFSRMHRIRNKRKQKNGYRVEKEHTLTHTFIVSDKKTNEIEGTFCRCSCVQRERYGKKPWLFSSSEQSEMILGEAKKRSVPLCTTFSWSERFSFARFGVYGLAYLQTNRCEPYAHSVHIVFCIRKISIESFLSTTSRAH